MALPGDTQSTEVKSIKELSRNTTMELTDSEVQAVFSEIVQIQRKYAHRSASRPNLESLKDEVLTKLMHLGILATFDPTPLLDGEPPAVEILGKMPGSSMDKFGFDHEKEQWEVQRANERNQEVYKEKE